MVAHDVGRRAKGKRMKPPRYVPPPRPKQPSKDDQALRRMTDKVRATLVQGLKNVAEAKNLPVKQMVCGALMPHDVEHIAVEMMTAYEAAVRHEEAREALDDDIRDVEVA